MTNILLHILSTSIVLCDPHLIDKILITLYIIYVITIVHKASVLLIVKRAIQ